MKEMWKPETIPSLVLSIIAIVLGVICFYTSTVILIAELMSNAPFQEGFKYGLEWEVSMVSSIVRIFILSIDILDELIIGTLFKCGNTFLWFLGVVSGSVHALLP